jgi:TorA maturation chaperone TorD
MERTRRPAPRGRRPSDAGVADAAEEARFRSSLYGFLARVFAAEATTDVLEEMRQPEFRAALHAAGAASAVDPDGADAEQVVEGLGIEYARLFLGPGKHISPYSSMHLDGGDRLWGPSTQWVHAFFAKAGFEPPLARRNPPDHIAGELLFLHALTAAEAETEDRTTRERLRAVQRCFLERHLLRWAGRFFSMVADEAQSALYCDAAKLARGFLESEIEHLTAAPAPVPAAERDV